MTEEKTKQFQEEWKQLCDKYDLGHSLVLAEHIDGTKHGHLISTYKKKDKHMCELIMELYLKLKKLLNENKESINLNQTK